MNDLLSLVGGSREAVFSLVLAWLAPRFLQWLKSSNLPIMQEGAETLNRWVAVVAAVLATIGVHWTFTAGPEGWQIALSGAHQSVGAFLADVARQFMLQQGAYKAMGTTSDIGGLLKSLVGKTSVIALLAASMAGSACAGKHAPTMPGGAAALVQLSPAEEDVQATRLLAIQVADEATALTRRISAIRDGAEQLNLARVVSDKQMDQIDRACLEYVRIGRIASKSARAAMTRPSLLNTAEMVSASALDVVGVLSGSNQLKAWAQEIKALMPQIQKLINTKGGAK